MRDESSAKIAVLGILEQRYVGLDNEAATARPRGLLTTCGSPISGTTIWLSRTQSNGGVWRRSALDLVD
jgi:hypothetical protein